MTAADSKAFAAILHGLAEIYGEAVSPLRAELYFRALDDLSLEDVKRAANLHSRRSKFFPKPAELREAVTGPVEDRAELAWSAVLKLVRRCGYYQEPAREDWPDEQTRRAAMELYGGWHRLCEALPGEGVGLVTAAKQFKATYGAYARREEYEWAELPPSREEAKRVLSAIMSGRSLES